MKELRDDLACRDVSLRRLCVAMGDNDPMRRDGGKLALVVLGLAGLGVGAVADMVLFAILRGGLDEAASLVAILAFPGPIVYWLWKLIRGKDRDTPSETDPGSTPDRTADNGARRKPPAAHAQPPKPVTTTQRALAAFTGCAVAVVAFGVYLIVPYIFHFHHHQVADPSRLLWVSSTGSAINGRPAVADGRVFVGNENGAIYGISLASPHRKWVYPTGDAVESSPVVVGGVVYIGSGNGYVYALNAATGKKVWKRETGGVGRATPVLAGGLVYIGTVTTIDGTPGGIMYGLRASDGTPQWHRELDGQVQAGAAVADGMVYVGTTAGIFYALSAATGDVEWKYAMAGQGGDWSTPVVVGGLVYVASGNCRVYALAASDGRVVMNKLLNQWFKASPALAGGVLYVGDMGRRSDLYGLATADLASSFDITLPKPLESSPAVADGVVYVGCQDGNLYAYSLATDRELWDFWAAPNLKQVNQVNSSPVVSGSVVYVGSGNGTLFALSTAVSGV
jgi:outer membrane protein assembly factor BamB